MLEWWEEHASVSHRLEGGALRKSLNTLVRKILLAAAGCSWLLCSALACQHSTEEILLTTRMTLLHNVLTLHTLTSGCSQCLPCRSDPSGCGNIIQQAGPRVCKAGAWPWSAINTRTIIHKPYKNTWTAWIDKTHRYARGVSDIRCMFVYLNVLQFPLRISKVSPNISHTQERSSRI